ncbi:MAG: guanylate kinase, partial [Paracoccus sp. (in: a-proteobacteria)]|nr:guanylate kinase [Paracoccus sp. (in: a-proteobacteria)]
PPRPAEVDGTHYHFITRQDFADRLSRADMLEHAEVFGNLYGTPRAPVEAAMQAGRDTIFDVDWQGGQQIRASALGPHVVSIFILPPSLAELERRLIARGQDAPGVIAARMDESRAEISHWAEYDYVLVNDDLETSFTRLVAILTAERLRRERQKSLGTFVRGLMEGERA